MKQEQSETITYACHPPNGQRDIIMTKFSLTHWGRVTHICVVNLIIIGSDNGLSPGWCQAIIWTNAAILLIGHLWTNFSEILIEIRRFSFENMCLKVSSAKWQPFCLGLNVLTPFMLAKEHEGQNRSMPWLLMTSLLTSPSHQWTCHQWTWHWLFVISES